MPARIAYPAALAENGGVELPLQRQRELASVLAAVTQRLPCIVEPCPPQLLTRPWRTMASSDGGRARFYAVMMTVAAWIRILGKGVAIVDEEVREPGQAGGLEEPTGE